MTTRHQVIIYKSKFQFLKLLSKKKKNMNIIYHLYQFYTIRIESITEFNVFYAPSFN